MQELRNLATSAFGPPREAVSTIPFGRRSIPPKSLEQSMDKPWDATFEKMIRQALALLPSGDELSPDLNTATFGLDSLAAVELLINIEAAYDIQVPEDLLQLSSFATPGSLWKLIGDVRETDGSKAP
ncbi:acyl carrier protein [Streptomyces mirabilis]|uniref:acyl carrier protein n=1 Tax=Streptomyces mirabilis TaxID=68239 RepID=UPI0033F7EF0C